MREHYVRSANRRAVLAWRRLKAGFVDTRVSRACLAETLGVAESGVSAKIAAVRKALSSRLPVGPHDAPAILDVLATSAPDELKAMISQADAICGHTFDLLGSGPAHLGPRIDWQCDFKSGYRWDASTHYAGIRLGEEPGVDVKVPWELSRGQHLPLLAQAYVLTGDRRYAREAVDEILDWIGTNPPEFGVNWVCPMDVAIRAVNWLWTAALLSTAPEAGEEFFEALLASLIAHGNYLRGNLEVMPDGHRTNHYIADLVGMLYLGLCVPEVDAEKRWASFARTELAREIDRQVLHDGVSFESSIPYHRLAAEMFLSAALLARHHGVGFDDAFMDRLDRMIEFTAAYTKPNGLAPQIGDADDGRLHVLTGYGTADPRDHRHLLSAGAVLFDRIEWRALSGDRWTEALWLGGVHRRPEAAAVPQRQSAAFEDAGVYILRNKDDVVVLTAGAVGTDGLGNHKHNDLLAIEVHLAGEDVLVDPGSYIYTPDPDARNAFRSTGAHTTVTVDGAEQNRIPSASLFSLHDDAVPRLILWRQTADGGTITAEHDGYLRLDAPVRHRRTVCLTQPHHVMVEDTFVHTTPAKSSHRLAWTLAFAPKCRVIAGASGWHIMTPAGKHFVLTPPVDVNGTRIPSADRLGESWVSPRYGVREPAPVVRWTWEGPLPLSIQFHVQEAVESGEELFGVSR